MLVRAGSNGITDREALLKVPRYFRMEMRDDEERTLWEVDLQP